MLCHLFRLPRMHEMQTIVTDVRGVCLSVTRRVHCVRGHLVQPCRLTLASALPLNHHVWRGGSMVGRRLRDRKVAGSIPGLCATT